MNKLLVFANSSTKRKVDLEEYVGWVDGMYIFKDRPFGRYNEDIRTLV